MVSFIASLSRCGGPAGPEVSSYGALRQLTFWETKKAFTRRTARTGVKVGGLTVAARERPAMACVEQAAGRSWSRRCPLRDRPGP